MLKGLFFYEFFFEQSLLGVVWIDIQFEHVERGFKSHNFCRSQFVKNIFKTNESYLKTLTWQRGSLFALMESQSS